MKTNQHPSFGALQSMLCVLLMVLPFFMAAQDQAPYLEVDLVITVKQRRADNGEVTIIDDTGKQRIAQAHKGRLFIDLPLGHVYTLNVRADNAHAKSLMFDTSDPKAKMDSFPCAVDLKEVERNAVADTALQTPSAVINWHRFKREWAYDEAATQKLQLLLDEAEASDE